MKGTTTLNGRVELEEALFNEEQLEKAMESDSSITYYYRDIYLCGIERQATGDTVSEAQAKAIAITHKKIAKVPLGLGCRLGRHCLRLRLGSSSGLLGGHLTFLCG